MISDGLGQYRPDILQDWKEVVTPTEQAPSVVGIDRFYRQVASRIQQFGTTAAGRDEFFRLLVDLEAMLQSEPHRMKLREMLSHLNQNTKWSLVEHFDRRAGVHLMELPGWNPESPALRIRKSLTETKDTDHVLTGHRSLTLNISDSESADFQVRIGRNRVGFLPGAPTSVVVQTDQDQESHVLDNQVSETQFTKRIKGNRGYLEIRNEQPMANHYVRVRIDELDGKGNVVSDEASKFEPTVPQRMYHVATRDEPLVIRVAGPTILRVDRLEGTEIVSQVFSTSDTTATFELFPPEGDSMALFRIHERQLNEHPTLVHRAQPTPGELTEQWVDDVVDAVFDTSAEMGFVSQASAVEEVDQLALRPPDLQPAVMEFNDGVELGLQERGTWEIDFGYQHRRAIEEFLSLREPDQFFELGVSRHFFDAWNNQYSTGSFFLRPRIDSGPTVGFRRQTWSEIPLAKRNDSCGVNGWGAYQIHWDIYGFAQHAGTPLVAGASSHPWTTGFRVELTCQQQLGEYTRHRPVMRIFGRYLSEDFNGFAPGELDQDIFTQYKSDHRYGIRIADRFVFQRMLDRRWWVRPSLTSNPDQLVPDNLGVQFGADQLIGPLQLRLDYRLTGFLVDNDRNRAVVQNVLNLDVLFETWHSTSRRSEWNFFMRHDLGEGGTSVGLSFANLWNQGRGYRDINPQSMLFRSLRQERAIRIARENR